MMDTLLARGHFVRKDSVCNGNKAACLNVCGRWGMPLAPEYERNRRNTHLIRNA